MGYMKIGALLSVFMVLLVSCTATQQQYAIDTAKTAALVSNLTTQYNNIELVIENKKHKCTLEEQVTLETAKNTFHMLLTRLSAISQIQGYELTTFDIQGMWTSAKINEENVKRVVAAHWAEFEPGEQAILRIFDEQFQDADLQVQKMLANPTHDNMMTTLALVAGGLTLSMKLLAGLALL